MLMVKISIWRNQHLDALERSGIPRERQEADHDYIMVQVAFT